MPSLRTGISRPATERASRASSFSLDRQDLRTVSAGRRFARARGRSRRGSPRASSRRRARHVRPHRSDIEPVNGARATTASFGITLRERRGNAAGRRRMVVVFVMPETGRTPSNLWGWAIGWYARGSFARHCHGPVAERFQPHQRVIGVAISRVFRPYRSPNESRRAAPSGSRGLVTAGIWGMSENHVVQSTRHRPKHGPVAVEIAVQPGGRFVLNGLRDIHGWIRCARSARRGGLPDSRADTATARIAIKAGRRGYAGPEKPSDAAAISVPADTGGRGPASG